MAVSPITARAKAHAESLGRKQIEVVEWPDDDGKPTLLYCSPITLGEMKRFYKAINSDDISVFVDLIKEQNRNQDW